MQGSIHRCKLIALPMRKDERGSLCFMESNRHVPFPIQRLFYVYGVQPNANRGAHAHKALHQFVIPVAGSFEIELDDGQQKRIEKMEDPAKGLHIPPMIWNELRDFSPGAVCAVLASDYYDESDYFRDYRQFLMAARGGQ